MCKKYIDLLFFLGIGIFFIKQCSLKFTSGNKWRSTKVGAKLLSDLVMFSIVASDIPFDFYHSTWVVPLKYLMYFLVGVNTK